MIGWQKFCRSMPHCDSLSLMYKTHGCLCFWATNISFGLWQDQNSPVFGSQTSVGSSHSPKLRQIKFSINSPLGFLTAITRQHGRWGNSLNRPFSQSRGKVYFGDHSEKSHIFRTHTKFKLATFGVRFGRRSRSVSVQAT